MNALIETLNLWGGRAIHVAWPLLWQSSLLIALLFALDYVLRRRVRAAVRYALWLVVLVKLLLPPSLALPTGLAWWLRPEDKVPHRAPQPKTTFVVTYGNLPPTASFPVPATKFVPPPTQLSRAAWTFLGWATVGAGLFGWLLVRWRLVIWDVRRATPAPGWLEDLFAKTQSQAGLRRPVRMRLTNRAMSPAVCGLFRPVVLLPQSLTEHLPPAQLRAVLLHELIHLRRADVWVNCAQALLQIVYWWHPLLWLANARIRRVREEAVDDAVMLALRDGAETYAPTLLEVARLAFDRPLASLGLVGILESRSALHQRIERLIDFRPPQRAGLTVTSALCVLAFGALAAPMGQAPPPAAAPNENSGVSVDADGSTNIETRIFRVDTNALFARLREETGLGTNDEIQVGMAFEKLFSGLGLDIRAPGRVFWFKDRQGMLLIRATPKELGSVERLITSLNGAWLPGPGPIPATEPPFPAVGTGSAAALMQQGRLLFETGKYDEAEIKLTQAVSLDPENRSALYYLSLVKEHLHTEAERQREQSFKKQVEDAAKASEPSARSEALPLPNPYALTNHLISNSPGRLAIITKLDRIRLDSVAYEGWTLSEVVRNLSEESRKGDPEGRGINFLINPNARPRNIAIIDQVTGLPGPAAPSAEARDIGDLVINIKPALANARLVDVLDAIVKGADKPIRYSVQDYAIVFSPREPGEPLETRVFKVDPNTFSEGLEPAGVLISGATIPNGESTGAVSSSGLPPQGGASGGGYANGGHGGGGSLRFITSTNTGEKVAAAARRLFIGLGADVAQPGKSVFFNNRGNTLFVRATAKDLDIIESALQVLNTPPYQVNIKVRFVEIDTAAVGALGLDMFLGNLATTNISKSPEAGTFPGALPAAKNPNETNPSPASGQPAANPGASLTGILTEPQFRTVLKTLEQNEGADLLAAPEVTTLSGRQAQVQVMPTQYQSIVQGINPKALILPGVPMAEGTNGLYQIDTTPLGPMLDVIPVVSADGYSIQLTVIPTLTEFLGYDKADETVPVYVNGKLQTVPLPLPRYRVRQTTSHAVVWDGQTLVLGSLPATEVSVGPDGQQQSTTPRDPLRKQIIVFVTPTIIDPAGNRLHSDDQMPSSQKAFPSQPK